MPNINFISIESSKFTPKEKYCLIKPDVQDPEEKADSGIVVTIKKDVINIRPCSGIVVASGNTEEAPIGKRVIFPNTDGLDMKFSDGNFLMLKIESIVGIEDESE